MVLCLQTHLTSARIINNSRPPVESGWDIIYLGVFHPIPRSVFSSIDIRLTILLGLNILARQSRQPSRSPASSTSMNPFPFVVLMAFLCLNESLLGAATAGCKKLKNHPLGRKLRDFYQNLCGGRFSPVAN